MLSALTKGWYLSYYKCQRKNLNVYPNIYSRESSFLFRGNSTVKFNHKKSKQIKQDRYFDATNKKFTNYCL